jgi:hypothetical protein
MPASEQLPEIQGFARFKFHDAKVEELKRLCAEFMDIVRAKDTGTLQFEIYLSDYESECVIYEYRCLGPSCPCRARSPSFDEWAPEAVGTPPHRSVRSGSDSDSGMRR